MKKEIGNNIKYTIEEVRRYIYDLGFMLLNKEYINNKQKLILKDKEGYFYLTTLSIIKRRTPAKFHTLNPYTISNIKLWLKINSQPFELLSDTYINNSTNLIFKDKDGYLYSSYLNNIFDRVKRGELPRRFDISNCYTIENIKLWLKLNNSSLELMDKVYLGTNYKLKLKDNKGYMYSLSWNNLQQDKNVQKFYITNSYTIQNIKLWCKLNDKPFILLSDTYEGSHKYLKWKCLKDNCGEVFEMIWNSIFQGEGCSYCHGLKVGLSNCLATKNPELASEWHPTLNDDLTPYDVTANSGQSVWWKCKECGHKWEATLNHRNGRGDGCPECSKSHGEKRVRKWLNENNIYYIPQKTFDDLMGLGGGLLSYDFYLPQYNLLIEYQGQFHDGSSGEYAKVNLEKQVEHDRRKKNYALLHKYNFLEIWYYDYDRVEEILNNELLSLNYHK